MQPPMFGQVHKHAADFIPGYTPTWVNIALYSICATMAVRQFFGFTMYSLVTDKSTRATLSCAESTVSSNEEGSGWGQGQTRVDLLS